MRFVFASYVYTKEFNQPQAWLKRINMYSGILEALSKTDEVISIEQVNYEGQFYNNGADYRFLRFGRNSLRFFPLKLHRYIKRLKPDVVFIQGLHFPLQVIQLRLLLGPRVKIIVQNHAEKPFSGLKKILQKLADRCIDAYLFASYDMGVEWVANGNLANASKIHEVMEVSSVFYPIDQKLAREKTGISGNKAFLWVSRLNDNKDPLTVVKAFLAFAESNPEARLYMIYHTDELLNDITALQTDAITLVGRVPHNDLLYWFNSVDFIVSGSHYEGSGAAVCEAMSCGCIPVVTDILSFRMITDNGSCGILYPPGNEQALLSALNQTLYIDIEEKRKLTLTHFKSTLSFEAIAGKISKIAASL
ncbi:glycosyltransferase family 4 protein [Mucilaginibacter aquariorum]|uniref:Glycosyltransferase family 4 protein n=1 Tax=Mucilaginibacter aquariorum TaxID=2967225 RepID=A0ABT1T3L7_9SPHI|nr:glycosyltransferase family 4 protein [Mucilaginibacter aquariorum]MCQ6959068.1 glycosyltransferase family 4 protein [Mucilaginibacter aquariorum]